MDAPTPESVFLVFGDLHGKILPAFRLASVWSREHKTPLAGLLQVGDMGYFPDINTIDKATLRHAKDDPLELGTFDIIQINPLADQVFDDPHSPPGLWFTAGNHEDFAVLEQLARASGDQPDFVVDAYCRVRGIKDGQVKPFECGLKVGAIWGVDGGGPNARQNLPKRGYIWEKSVSRLVHEPFDVLLCHDAPQSARWIGYGSRDLRSLIELAQPAFACFGHYSGAGARIEQDFGRTEVYHMASLELGGKDGTPKSGSVGVLRCADSATFEYVPDEWLKTFSRHNWKWR
jgi:hypothetical protein